MFYTIPYWGEIVFHFLSSSPWGILFAKDYSGLQGYCYQQHQHHCMLPEQSIYDKKCENKKSFMKRELQNGCMTSRYKFKGSWTEGCHFWVDPGIGEVERVQKGLRLRFRESHFLRLFALVYLFLLSSVLDFIKLSKGATQILAMLSMCSHFLKDIHQLEPKWLFVEIIFQKPEVECWVLCRVLLKVLTFSKDQRSKK